MMYEFFITIHAQPPGATAGASIELNGRTVSTLHVDREALSTTTMDCTFEAARTRLELLPRMFCEADGSFVCVSRQGAPAWQVDGNLYDRNERLLFVDLKGTCPAEELDRFLTALGWPETRLMFQLTREAVFLDEAEFRRYAAIDPSPLPAGEG
ncbi:MAG TPA: hypothetical protein VGZ26_12245 [Pirellulales bacterium]|jgi:hypothetical protein|nr:hypothetical protein [Pirellulales bacterium]